MVDSTDLIAVLEVSSVELLLGRLVAKGESRRDGKHKAEDSGSRELHFLC